MGDISSFRWFYCSSLSIGCGSSRPRTDLPGQKFQARPSRQGEFRFASKNQTLSEKAANRSNDRLGEKEKVRCREEKIHFQVGEEKEIQEKEEGGSESFGQEQGKYETCGPMDGCRGSPKEGQVFQDLHRPFEGQLRQEVLRFSDPPKLFDLSAFADPEK